MKEGGKKGGRMAEKVREREWERERAKEIKNENELKQIGPTCGPRWLAMWSNTNP